MNSINTTKGNYPPTQLNKLPLNSGGRKLQAAFCDNIHVVFQMRVKLKDKPVLTSLAIADLAPGKGYLERTLDQHNSSLTIIASSS